ncbi:Imm8 family immunity protein [Microtetraspora malaysiensis]|uniref:Imm8 family immunity protein n=1 Tax=Microtetraspora malaysiensis TaxID=161358 RepID=UPI003D8FBAD0
MLLDAVTLYVGPQSEPGEERFQLTVCTPSALAERGCIIIPSSSAVTGSSFLSFVLLRWSGG